MEFQVAREKEKNEDQMKGGWQDESVNHSFFFFFLMNKSVDHSATEIVRNLNASWLACDDHKTCMGFKYLRFYLYMHT
jgi:hypothetical protein